MNLSRAFTRSVLLTVLLGLGAYLLSSGDIGLGLLVVPLFLLGWVVTGLEGAPKMPRGMVLSMTGIAVAFVLVSLAFEKISIEVLSRFMAVLLVVKAFDRREPRDHAQLLALALFLVLGAVTLNVRLLPGLMALLFVPAMVASVLLYQIESGRHGVGGASQQHSGDRPGFKRDLSLLGIGAGAVACLIVSVVFVLVPRGLGQGTGGGALPRPSAGSVTGFSEDVDLGAGGTIQQDESIVLDVRPLEDKAETYAVAPPILYLRGAVLETYSSASGRWSSRAGEGLAGTPGTQGWYRIADRPRASDELYEITIRNAPRGSVTLFLPEGTVGLRPADPIEPRVYPGFGLAKEWEWPGGRLRYEVRLARSAATDPQGTQRTEVDTSGIDPSIVELASGILLEGGIESDPARREIVRDLAAAHALRRHLLGQHEYSLDRPRIPPGRDPIAWFLETRSAGHCEFFAGALVEMCRAVGINARVVTGYVAAEFNPATGAYIVRRSNAHAWAEIERSEGDWVQLDPTPSADLHEIHQPPTNALRRARLLLDVFEQYWVNSIIAFDSSRRQELLGLESSSDLSTGSRSLDVFAQRLVSTRLGDVGRAVGVGLLAGCLTAALGFGGIWLVRHRLGRRRAQRAFYPWQRWPGGVADRLYRALLESFEQRGHPKPDTTPLLRHARRTGEDDLARAAEALCAARFGIEDRDEELAAALGAMTRGE